MSKLIPPSAFEVPTATEDDSTRLLQTSFEDIDRRVRDELLRRMSSTSGTASSPLSEHRVFESAIKNQASLIDQLHDRLAKYEHQIATLQHQLVEKQNDLELIANQCEMSLATLDDEHTRSITKIENELESCRSQLEREVSLRLANEERFAALEDKNKLKLGYLQASLDEKIGELKEAREESAKLRLYFTGGRDLVPFISNEKPTLTNAAVVQNVPESETITNLRVQIEALQHIIDVQEEQLRTSKPDLIPGLATLEKWRRKVYEMMVRTKLHEISVDKETAALRQETNSAKERLHVTEAKLAAKEMELKEVKARFDVNQKQMTVTSGNEAKLRSCIEMMAQGLASIGAKFKDTASRSLLQLANMERRLDLAAKRIRQIGANQRSANHLQAVLEDRNSEKVAFEMQIVMANETISELRRQLTFCQQQLSSASKQKANALEVVESDRMAERDAAIAQIRSLASELQELRVEHAKLIAHYGNVKRQLEETEEREKNMFDSLNARLKECHQDYEALAKVAREHGVVERVAARRMAATPPASATGAASDAVRAQVESLYKSLIR